MLLIALIFLTFVLLSDFVQCNPSISKNAKIAIIGGGTSGLLAARGLGQLGYTNITIFEKNEEVAALTESLTYNGVVYDLGTKFLPSDYINGSGLDPGMAALIAEYNVTLKPAAPIIFSQGGQPLPVIPAWLPYMVNQSMTQNLVLELIEGFELLQALDLLAANETVSGYLAANIFGISLFGNLTYGQWIQLIPQKGFVALLETIGNIFLQYPDSSHEVAWVLRSRKTFAPQYIKAYLLAFGVNSSTILPISSQLRNMLRDPYPGVDYLITEGYQTLWNRLAAQPNLRVLLSTTVTQVNIQNKKFQVSYTNGTNSTQSDNYDYVFFALSPRAASQILGTGLESANALYSQALFNNQAYAYSAALLVNLTTLPAAWLGAYGGVFSVVLYPQAANCVADGTTIAYSREDLSSNVLLAIGYMSQNQTAGDVKAAILQQLQNLNVATGDFLDIITHQWPNPAVASDSWVRSFSALQGVNKAYYIGETFCGAGVPTILECVTAMLQPFQ